MMDKNHPALTNDQKLKSLNMMGYSQGKQDVKQEKRFEYYGSSRYENDKNRVQPPSYSQLL